MTRKMHIYESFALTAVSNYLYSPNSRDKVTRGSLVRMLL